MPCSLRPPGFVPRVEHHDLVPERGEPVRAGQAGRPGADDGDPAARRRALPVGRLAGRHHGIGGVALQEPDRDRLALRGVAHAGLLAEGLGRAHPGAHAAEDVGVEDRLGRRPGTLPVAIWRMKSGMSMPVGQAVTQGAS